MTLVGAGTAGSLVLITGLTTFLHTPCGGLPEPLRPGWSRQRAGLIRMSYPLLSLYLAASAVGGGSIFRPCWHQSLS